MQNNTSSAFILIDMENTFVLPEGSMCIKNALNTVPACRKALSAARSKGMPVFFVKRVYRANGSDVEACRFAGWNSKGRPITPGSEGIDSAEAPEFLKPEPGDYSIVKPRWSAFFQTELDLILRRLGIRTVVLAGTTTPNCIRTTCYDALALEYNCVVIEDCCSSQTEEIQRVNIQDMQRIGAQILTCDEFVLNGTSKITDQIGIAQSAVSADTAFPENFEKTSSGISKIDKW